MKDVDGNELTPQVNGHITEREHRCVLTVTDCHLLPENSLLRYGRTRPCHATTVQPREEISFHNKNGGTSRSCAK